MTLGKLISILKVMDPNEVMPNGFNNPHSYRGYYEQLAFEPAMNVKVRDMLKDAEDSLGKTFTGYKGGQFKMESYTDIWIANYGSTVDEDHSPSEIELMHYFNKNADDVSVKALKDLVEAFYRHTGGLPKTSVTFKMKMIQALDLLKAKQVELPAYEKFRANKEKAG